MTAQEMINYLNLLPNKGVEIKLTHRIDENEIETEMFAIKKVSLATVGVVDQNEIIEKTVVLVESNIKVKV